MSFVLALGWLNWALGFAFPPLVWVKKKAFSIIGLIVAKQVQKQSFVWASLFGINLKIGALKGNPSFEDKAAFQIKPSSRREVKSGLIGQLNIRNDQ